MPKSLWPPLPLFHLHPSLVSQPHLPPAHLQSQPTTNYSFPPYHCDGSSLSSCDHSFFFKIPFKSSCSGTTSGSVPYCVQRVPYTRSGWYTCEETKAGLGRERSCLTRDLGLHHGELRRCCGIQRCSVRHETWIYSGISLVSTLFVRKVSRQKSSLQPKAVPSGESRCGCSRWWPQEAG